MWEYKYTPTTFIGFQYEIVGCADMDQQVEQYLADGVREAYAVCIVLDGEEFKFNTMDEFKRVISGEQVIAKQTDADLPPGLSPKGKGVLTFHKSNPP